MDLVPVAATPPPGRLHGRRVVVTRAAEPAGRLRALLEAAGATVVEVPVVELVDAADGGLALRAAAARLAAGAYAWVVLTSANGVARLVGALEGRAVPATTSVAAVGRATASALVGSGLTVALVPERFVGEALVDVFPPAPPAGAPAAATAVLVAQAAGARPVVVDGLRRAGWVVDAVAAYATVPVVVDPQRAAAAAGCDVVTFTSASSVTGFLDALGSPALPPLVVCIGPVTAQAAIERGVRVDTVAEESTLEGLVAAVVAAVGPGLR